MVPGGLRIGVLKPDVGVAGGFERVVDRVVGALRRDGHDVELITVAIPSRAGPTFGVDVTDATWGRAPEYFRYLAGVEAFDAVPTDHLDVVVSTQPPSFCHRHPRHLSLFFHHHRIFYELEDLWVDGGFAPDADLHRRAGERVRAIDQERLGSVRWFAAGSETVRRRLARANGIDRVSLFHAGLAVGRSGARVEIDPSRRRGPVLCVGRLEFPKRPELVVAAMRRLPEVAAVLVGGGGRQEWVRAVDHHLAAPGTDLDAVDEHSLWARAVEPGARAPRGWTSNVEVAGRVDDARLEHLYATTRCVVAPAHDEDYGLTAVEAMAHGAPVVVCEDGGGLADLVEHEVNGLIVAPTGRAIAAAVERILSDDDLATTLSHGARQRAARTTWEQAEDELRTALALTLDGADR